MLMLLLLLLLMLLLLLLLQPEMSSWLVSMSGKMRISVHATR